MQRDSLVQILSGGRRNAIGKADVVAESILHNPELLPELLDSCCFDNPTVKSRATYSMMILASEKPSILNAHIPFLLEQVAPDEQWEVRAHLCQILPKLSLHEHQLDQAVAHFTHYLKDPRSFVKTAAMQALVDVCAFDPRFSKWVKKIIGDCSIQGTAAMRARGRKLIRLLEKNYP